MSRTVRTVANRGKTYEVEFNNDGTPLFVTVLYRRNGHPLSSTVEREIWHQADKKMSLTAKCAIQAAIRTLDDRAKRSAVIK